jgi:hypothetical protein
VNKKKSEEIVILNLFRNCYEDFPKGILKATESPDFILSLGTKKKYGLELTRLHLHIPDADLYSFENISACINLKEDKLLLYRKKRLQEYWLILTAEDSNHQSRYNIHNKLLIWEFETSFNRIFLFNVFKPEVIRLKKPDRG